MTIDGNELIEGKFFLWRVAKQQGTDVDLHSVYFMTQDNGENPKFYEVVFTKADQGTVANGWYLVEKKVKPDIPEAVIVEDKPTNDAQPDTLEVQVEDELKLGELLSGG